MAGPMVHPGTQPWHAAADGRTATDDRQLPADVCEPNISRELVFHS